MFDSNYLTSEQQRRNDEFMTMIQDWKTKNAKQQIRTQRLLENLMHSQPRNDRNVDGLNPFSHKGNLKKQVKLEPLNSWAPGQRRKKTNSTANSPEVNRAIKMTQPDMESSQEDRKRNYMKIEVQ